jgi:hypothetical protein
MEGNGGPIAMFLWCLLLYVMMVVILHNNNSVIYLHQSVRHGTMISSLPITDILLDYGNLRLPSNCTSLVIYSTTTMLLVTSDGIALWKIRRMISDDSISYVLCET